MPKDTVSQTLSFIDKMERAAKAKIAAGEEMVLAGQAELKLAKTMREAAEQHGIKSSKPKNRASSVQLRNEDKTAHADVYGRWSAVALEALGQLAGHGGNLDQITNVASSFDRMRRFPNKAIRKKMQTTLHTMARAKDAKVRYVKLDGAKPRFELV